MRLFLFVCGGTIVAMGVAALQLMDRSQSLGFSRDALTLGGALVICGLFSIRMFWHGLIGAGVVALMGAAMGLTRLPGVFQFFQGERLRGSLPVFEFGVTVICLLLLTRVVRVLKRERLRRMLATED